MRPFFKYLLRFALFFGLLLLALDLFLPPRSIVSDRSFLGGAVIADAYAQYGYDSEDSPSFKASLYKLLRSPFGTLLMVFCGLAGFATLYIKREGPAGKQVPMMGVVLLIAAIFLFGLRVMLSSGMMGQEYLDYGR